jgi:transposase
MLANLETNEVVDRLPDREAATVDKGLRAHPCVKIVARDRAGAHADGIRQGAPDAVQVADRWHLLRNLGDAVKVLADRHAGAAVRTAEHVRSHLQMSAATPSSRVPTPDLPKPTRVELDGTASWARRQSGYEEAARLHAAGASIERIAAERVTERKTVRR